MKCPCEDCFEKDAGEWNGCHGEYEDCTDYMIWQLQEEAEYMRSELEAGAIRPGVYPNDFLDKEATPDPSESGGEDKEDYTPTPTGAGAGCLETTPTPAGEDERQGGGCPALIVK